MKRLVLALFALMISIAALAMNLYVRRELRKAEQLLYAIEMEQQSPERVVWIRVDRTKPLVPIFLLPETGEQIPDSLIVAVSPP